LGNLKEAAMPTTTRDRIDEIQALEELWAAPAVEEPKPTTRRRRLPLVPGGLVAAGWVAFFAAASLAPPPEPGMTWATWAIAVELVMIALLFGAAGLGAIFGRIGFGGATLAGLLLIPLAVNCRAAEHHLGNWWLAELGAALALTGLAAVGLRQRLRGE
jgi:hypothetical protein